MTISPQASSLTVRFDHRRFCLAAIATTGLLRETIKAQQ